MIRRTPRSNITYTLFPYTTLFRSYRNKSRNVIANNCVAGQRHAAYGAIRAFPVDTKLPLGRRDPKPFVDRHRLANKSARPSYGNRQVEFVGIAILVNFFCNSPGIGVLPDQIYHKAPTSSLWS